MSDRTNYSRAIDDVVAERLRQVDSEGFTAEHDDRHGEGHMALAAACYAFYRPQDDALSDRHGGLVRSLWPWGAQWWKPKDRRRDLVRAAALLIAEIERIDRAELANASEEKCPICAEPLKADDLCSTDIEMGICHAACLDGSPTVDLETGEPVDGPIPTYRYSDLDQPENPAQ